jgi:hypothetical protein
MRGASILVNRRVSNGTYALKTTKFAREFVRLLFGWKTSDGKLQIENMSFRWKA